MTPASGAFWPFKGDVSFENYLVEAKRTDKKGIRLTEDVLEKIYKEATNDGKIAGIELEFTDYYLQGVVYKK